MVKLSEVVGAVHCDGEVISVEEVREKVKDGYKPEILETLTDEWWSAVMKKAYDDFDGTEPVSAQNYGEQIIIN